MTKSNGYGCENLNQFKRGQNPQKSLEIGKYREITLAHPIDVNKIPLGTYVATSRDGDRVILEFSEGENIKILTYWYNQKLGSEIILNKKDFRTHPIGISTSMDLENLGVIKIQRYDIDQ